MASTVDIQAFKRKMRREQDMKRKKKNWENPLFKAAEAEGKRQKRECPLVRRGRT